jgi:hypothetical protein
VGEEGVVGKLPGPRRPLDLVLGEDDGEDPPDQPLFELGLGEAADEGALPLVDPPDLSEGGLVVGSGPFRGCLELVFEIVV